MKWTGMYNSRGFSLTELLVVMAIFVVITAVTGATFSRILSRASTQTKSAESNIEGIIGLEMMRKDLASAGFGLPWSFDAAITYKEVNPTGGPGETLAAAYNRTANAETQTEVPMAVSGGNDLTSSDSNILINGSDYLVVRASSVGSSSAAQRWSFMNYTGIIKPTSLSPESWTRENLAPSDWVMVVRVGLSSSFTKELVTHAGSFSTQYNNLLDYEPDSPRITNYIYGLDDATQPRMPFNRADFYVRVPSATDANPLPQRCAPNTGVLFKSLVKQSDGTTASSEFPLLDCVADMQVVYGLGSSTGGVVTETSDLTGFTPEDIRARLKSIQVYVLSHEGGKDRLYTHANQTIGVGPTTDGLTSGMGRTFNFSSAIGSGWENYRWKVYRFSVNPLNLGSTL